MSSLVMLGSEPVVETRPGEVVLDVQLVEKMKLYCQLWPGRVRCVLWRDPGNTANGMRYSVDRLGFDLVMLEPGVAIPGLLLDEAGLVYCSADEPRFWSLSDEMRRRVGRLVFTVRTRPAEVKQGGATWHRFTAGPRREATLRRALRHADALQFNGFPAQAAYRRLTTRGFIFHETRLRAPMLARATDQQARAARVQAGAPLRLVYMGLPDAREIQDLLATAYLMRTSGLAYRLDILTAGQPLPRLEAGLSGLGLQHLVRLHHNACLDVAQVSALRSEADLFISPQRHGHANIAYLEAMGCGLPVLAYGNSMWRRLQAEAGAGWSTRNRSPESLTREIVGLAAAPARLLQASEQSLRFARQHSFESMFARSVAHLREVAELD